ncbi:hypothetical protein LSTR_LSTR015326 [Laodelphax striatellus]|uniref:Uncharacterized protein n=1 Tax=Laodelphax striatellus TaxID=195883 RepID=A0A482WV18_LAOST|nr:hypothetical protein LSTR_LSTR015326 [Laodelphax striatellus]
MKHVVKKGFKPKENTRSSTVNSAVNGGISKIKESRFQKSNNTEEECVLSFPDLRIMNKAKLPCITSILLRSKEENINMTDLNQLQEELETMLSSVVIRKMNLNNEIEILNNMEDKKGSLPISNKTNQTKKSEERSLLKMNKPFKDTRNMNNHKNKLKSSMACTDSETMSDADGLSSAIAKMNDTANKFWAYVEQFCGDISTEDVKLLKELIEFCEKEAQGRKVPPLGKHYTVAWSEEDIADERDAGKLKRKADGTPANTGPTTTTDTKEAKEFLKKAEKVCMKDRIPGPLAQRMISAVLEENPSLSGGSFQGNGNRMKMNDDVEPLSKRQKLDMSSSDAESKGGENTVPNSFKKIPLLHNSLCFERNARRNLELIGFLEPPQIIEIYKKIADTKLKKKAIGEKVKKQAWKLIKDREQLQKQLDALAPELTV